MAEQSIGYATTGTGDGPAAGYDSARMTVIEAKTLGIGVLLQGAYLAQSGTGTATLAIADGSAVVATGTSTVTGGYLYENTSSASIAVGAVANGTYNLVILANESALSVTVTRSVAGTTITTKTTRLALATSAQLTTAAQPYIQLGTVTVASGLVSVITPYYQYANARQQRTQQFCAGNGGTSGGAMTASTFTSLVTYSANTNSVDGSMTFNTTNGAISIYQSGLYLFDFNLTFDTNATGNRMGSIQNLSSFPVVSAALYATNSNYRGSVVGSITVTPGTPQTYFLQGWSSVAGRSVTDSSIVCTRL
jgi:hypothetical protein